MNATDLSQLSMTELKAICASQSIEVVGDKRSKATYINAIETFQSLQTVIEIEIEQPLELPPMEANQLPDVLPVIDNETTSPLPVNQQRGASIVMLVPLILLSVAVIAIRIGIGTLIPLIAPPIRFMVSLWQSITHTDRGTESIDYFPTVPI
jgi:hypothetical protein